MDLTLRPAPASASDAPPTRRPIRSDRGASTEAGRIRRGPQVGLLFDAADPDPAALAFNGGDFSTVRPRETCHAA